MKEFTRTVEKEQIVYEITKEELDKIKRIERDKGRNDVIDYIRFCSCNFKLQLNIAGTVRLCEEIVGFITGNENYIDNIYGYAFNDYVKKYR